MTLSFDQVGAGLVSRGGGPLEGFAIAGPTGDWVWGDATISGKTVVVSSPSVPSPTHVRYAWGDNPVFSLYNTDGLPASPFTTESPDIVLPGSSGGAAGGGAVNRAGMNSGGEGGSAGGRVEPGSAGGAGGASGLGGSVAAGATANDVAGVAGAAAMLSAANGTDGSGCVTVRRYSPSARSLSLLLLSLGMAAVRRRRRRVVAPRPVLARYGQRESVTASR